MLAASVGLVLLAAACGVVDGTGTSHLASAPIDPRIAEVGLQRTDAGGIETILARDRSDTAKVAQVRALAQEQAKQFRQGHYPDPSREHGMEMPGSRDLEAGYSRVTVDFADLPAGVRLTYSASDPVLVTAIHSWFDRRELAR